MTILRPILLTAAAVTLLTVAAAVWLAVVMLRTPRDCGWCRNEHP